jgi:5-oxoprolinase (ATP-hydrolysing) subunit C
MRLRVETPETIAFGTQLVEAAGELLIESGALRVIYVAVHGGFAAPEVCGGRGTQLSAGIGAALRAGESLTVEASPGAVPSSPVPFVIDDAPLRIIPGPDAIPGALEALLASEFQISPSSDRVGTRLDGPALPARSGHGISRPMTRGAIELPPDGQPIVLGPEHPVTGGYPVIAVVATVDQGRLFARPIRARVQFKRSSGAAR